MPIRAEGPTPAGGADSIAYLTDSSGAVTDDLAAAVTMEIHECAADGRVLARTYGRTAPPGPEPDDHCG